MRRRCMCSLALGLTSASWCAVHGDHSSFTAVAVWGSFTRLCQINLGWSGLVKAISSLTDRESVKSRIKVEESSNPTDRCLRTWSLPPGFPDHWVCWGVSWHQAWLTRYFPQHQHLHFHNLELSSTSFAILWSRCLIIHERELWENY